MRTANALLTPSGVNRAAGSKKTSRSQGVGACEIVRVYGISLKPTIACRSGRLERELGKGRALGAKPNTGQPRGLIPPAKLLVSKKTAARRAQTSQQSPNSAWTLHCATYTSRLRDLTNGEVALTAMANIAKWLLHSSSLRTEQILAHCPDAEQWMGTWVEMEEHKQCTPKSQQWLDNTENEATCTATEPHRHAPAWSRHRCVEIKSAMSSPPSSSPSSTSPSSSAASASVAPSVLWFLRNCAHTREPISMQWVGVGTHKRTW